MRHQVPVYATGMFSNGSVQLAAVVVPLWMLRIDPSPLMVGIALGARQVLPVLLSIHGGALMDRMGIRRVMIWFSILGVVTPILFPLFPYFVAVLILQMLSGISAAMGWIGTQAQIGAIMKGSPTYAGRVTFFNRFGTLAGPPATGVAWDLGGPWGGFGFLTFWGVALLVACLAMPRARSGEVGGGTAAGGATWRDALPRVGDYVAAFRLMAIPAIAFVVSVTLLRHSSNGMLTSFYVVWLKSIGFEGALIGTLISVSSILGGVGSLCAGWLARMFTSYRVLILTVCCAILCVAITPALGASFVLLAIVSMLRGGFMGVSQPLLISIMAQSAGEAQGKAVGLRTTVNRVAILGVPVLMGGIAEVMGIAASFYVVGALLIALMLLVGWRSREAFAEAR